MCVLSMAAGVRWVGLNMKMQTWEIHAAPFLCTVRSFGRARNLFGCVCVCGWVGGITARPPDMWLTVTHVCVCLQCSFTRVAFKFTALCNFTAWGSFFKSRVYFANLDKRRDFDKVTLPDSYLLLPVCSSLNGAACTVQTVVIVDSIINCVAGVHWECTG